MKEESELTNSITNPKKVSLAQKRVKLQVQERVKRLTSQDGKDNQEFSNIIKNQNWKTNSDKKNRRVSYSLSKIEYNQYDPHLT